MSFRAAIVFDTDRPAMHHLARRIADGLGDAGVDARLIDMAQMTRVDWQALDDADAIVMGGLGAGFATFAAQTAAISQRQGWADKLAAGFCLISADAQDHTGLPDLMRFAARHGMVWVGHRAEGGTAQTGLAATETDPDTDPADTTEPDGSQAHHFGGRLARAVRRWHV